MPVDCLSTPRSGALHRRSARSARRSAPCPGVRRGPGAPATWLAPTALVLLLLAAVALAPEQPAELAAICERHNGPAACRVW